MRKGHNPTRVIAVKSLKHFFSAALSSDELTPNEIYRANGRDHLPYNTNRVWLHYHLDALEYHHLIKRIYKQQNGKLVLDRIKLTSDGLIELGRIAPEPLPTADTPETLPSEDPPAVPDVLAEVLKAMLVLRRQNPDYDITFKISLK